MTDPSKKRKYKIGDLVVFNSESTRVMKNQVGIIISTQVISAFQIECFKPHRWYVAQFGTMRLIVNDDMIKKLENDDDSEI